MKCKLNQIELYIWVIQGWEGEGVGGGCWGEGKRLIAVRFNYAIQESNKFSEGKTIQNMHWNLYLHEQVFNATVFACIASKR